MSDLNKKVNTTDWVVLAKAMNATVTSRQQSIASGHIQVVFTTAEKNHMPIRKGRERQSPFLPRHPSYKLNICLSVAERVEKNHQGDCVVSMDNSGQNAADQTQSLNIIPQVARAHFWGTVPTSSLAIKSTSSR